MHPDVLAKIFALKIHNFGLKIHDFYVANYFNTFKHFNSTFQIISQIVRKIQVVNLQAKVANLQCENVELRVQVSSMQDSLTILLAEHHKKQRLSPTEDSISAPGDEASSNS